MAHSLRIVAVTAKGTQELGTVHSVGEGEPIYLGREVAENDGLKIESNGVSRQHGVLMPLGSQWGYKDLESTNGSWLNGQRLSPGKVTIVRAGDALQLGDVGIKLLPGEEGETQDLATGGGIADSTRTLLVFARGEFLKEFPVPAYGRAAAFGGARADLMVDADLEELPSLVVEGRGEHVSAFSVSPQGVFSVNGTRATGSAILADRDELSVGQYTILYCDSSQGRASSSDVPPPRAGSDASSAGKSDGWQSPSSRPRTQVRTPFGQANEADGGATETMAISREDLTHRAGGSEIHPSMRRMMGEPEAPDLESVEDKFLILIGGILVVAVIALFLLWFLF